MPQPLDTAWPADKVRNVLAALFFVAAPSWALTAEFTAGDYSFSDELGGFSLLSASGTGTPDDPIVLVEEIAEAAPVTLVIRYSRSSASGRNQQLTLVKRVTNRSVRVWAAFEMELQEVLRKPSVYGDGLSFKQFDVAPPDAGSETFSRNERRFEPHDRIEFLDGHVDPDATAEFKVTITDPTPTREFYLVQDPKLLSSELPWQGGARFAVRLD